MMGWGLLGWGKRCLERPGREGWVSSLGGEWEDSGWECETETDPNTSGRWRRWFSEMSPLRIRHHKRMEC